MIFTLVSIVKEWLDEHNESETTIKDVAPLVDEFIPEKEGTPVTPETFALWFKGFKEEMDAKKKAASASSVLCGKEWFARSSTSTALLPAVTMKKDGDAPDIDWELFTAEEGDENLDDIEFDDENVVEKKEIGVYREPGTEDQGARDEVVDDDE